MAAFDLEATEELSHTEGGLDLTKLSAGLLGDPVRLGRGDATGSKFRAFVEEAGRVTVQEVAVRFATSKQTAHDHLERMELDSYEGPRGTRFFTPWTGK